MSARRRKPVEHDRPNGEGGAGRTRSTGYKEVSPWALKPALFNQEVYKPVDPNDPSIQALSDDIREHGLITPILINRENVIISGHRRATAACMAGIQTVRCEVCDVEEGTPEFERLLVSANKTREKTIAEVAHEAAIEIAPDKAKEWITAQRIAASLGKPNALAIQAPKRRKEITLNRDLADAVLRLVMDCEINNIKPTLRQVHYMLLNDPPFINTKKRNRYKNDKSSYTTLSDVATRLRISGEMRPNSILDPGRPFIRYQTFQDSRCYVRECVERFARDYRRNLMQTQPRFICAFIEKQTQQAIFEGYINEHYQGMPLAVCRGFSSISAIETIAEAWKESGKENMTLIGMSDCDPCGEDIAESIGKRLLEMGCEPWRFQMIRAGLTHDQAERLGARPCMVKATGNAGRTKAKKFADRHGGTQNVFELESVPPEELLKIFDEAVRSCLDIEAFNRECEDEKKELPELLAMQKELLEGLCNLN